MGFLDWFKGSREEAEGEIQSTQGSQLNRPDRVDGAIVNRRFREAIFMAGGETEHYIAAQVAETEELFDRN